MKKLINKYGEVIRYLIIGVLTTVVSLATYYLCVHTILNASNAIELQIANIISWVVSVTFAFFTNRSYVFKSTIPPLVIITSYFFKLFIKSIDFSKLSGIT